MHSLFAHIINVITIWYRKLRHNVTFAAVIQAVQYAVITGD